MLPLDRRGKRREPLAERAQRAEDPIRLHAVGVQVAQRGGDLDRDALLERRLLVPRGFGRDPLVERQAHQASRERDREVNHDQQREDERDTEHHHERDHDCASLGSAGLAVLGGGRIAGRGTPPSGASLATGAEMRAQSGTPEEIKAALNEPGVDHAHGVFKRAGASAPRS